MILDWVHRGYGLSMLLASLCLLFFLIVVVEWTQISMDIGESKERLAKPARANLELDELPDDDFALSSIESYAEMVAAPLTVSGRRPLSSDVGDTGSVEDVSVKTDLSAKLMGVYSTPDGTIGLFVDAKGDYTRVKEKEKMQGWLVEKLYPDRATLTQRGNSQELLLRKPKPKVTPRQPQAKSRSAPTRRRRINKPKN